MATRTLSAPEFERLLDALVDPPRRLRSAWPERDLALAWLIATTDIPLRDLLSVDVSDVDISSGGDAREVATVAIYFSEWGTVDLVPPAANAVAAFVTVRTPAPGPLFTKKGTSTPIDAQTVTRVVSAAMERADLQAFSYSVTRALRGVKLLRQDPKIEPTALPNLQHAREMLPHNSTGPGELDATHAPKADVVSELFTAWEDDLCRAERAERDLEDTRVELARLRDENKRLRDELSATEVGLGHDPATPLAAVELAARLCVHLEFHEDAFSTAAVCPYTRPDLLLRDFLLLDEVLGQWRSHGLPSGLAVACREVGLDWRADVSSTARTRFKSDYLHTIDGEVQFCGAHLVRGSKTPPTLHVRVHFWLEYQAQRVVVCYVGRHLRDASNR